MDKEMMQCLSRPFDPKQVQPKPGPGNTKLKYVSHGSVTARLNECDPSWHAEVLQEYHGQNGALSAIKMALTVGGVTRIEVGGPARNSGVLNDLKNGYSDALKRCAMRFGVALEMWEDLIDSLDDEDYPDMPPGGATSPVERRDNSRSGNVSRDKTSRDGANRGQSAPVAQSQRTDPVEASLTSGAATQRQLRYLQAAAREVGYDAAALDELAKKEFGSPAMTLSRADASALIEILEVQYSEAQIAPPQPKPEANGQTLTSKQDPDDPNSVLPTKRREAFIGSIFEHTKGQITATDLNNLMVDYGTSLPRITVAQSRELYTRILNWDDYTRNGIRDDLRRKYQPITDTLRKKLFAVVGKHTPAGVEKDNYLHVQLFEHLGLGSVKDMSTYDAEKMISVYEGQNFLDPAPVAQAPDGADGSVPMWGEVDHLEPPF